MFESPWKSFYKHKYDEWHVTIPYDQSNYMCALCPDGINPEFGKDRERLARLIAAAPELLEACVDAGMTFQHYAELHAAKGTPEGDLKAKRNLDMAKKLCKAIAKARGETS